MKRLTNALLLLFSLTVSFVAAEWLVRRLPVAEQLGWNLVPPVTERAHDQAEGRTGRRILVLGDSFAEWMEGSNKNFARIAEAEWRRAGEDVHVINLGEAGSGISDYYRNLVNHGPTLKPDVVVIALYLGNDMVPFPGGLPPPEIVPLRLSVPYEARRDTLKHRLKHSVLLNLAYRQAKAHLPWLQSGFSAQVLEYNRQQASRDPAFVTERLAHIDPELLRLAESDVINAWDLATAIFDPDFYGDLAEADPATRQGAQARAALPDLLALAAYARGLGAEVRVVLIPPSPWVADRYHGYFRRLGYGRLGPTSGEPPLVTLVKHELEAAGIPALDLLPVLRASDQPAFLDHDIHFSVHGQYLAGMALSGFLAR